MVGTSSAALSWDEIGPASSGRLCVAAIFDTVRVRAERAADPTAVRLHRSVSKMAEDRTLEAAVILDAGWGGLWAARTLCEQGLPTLWLSGWPDAGGWEFRGAANDLLIPGLRSRYLPSVIRLRERIATDLGEVDEIEVTTAGPAWEAADWAAWVAGSRLIDGEDGRVFLKSGVEASIRRGFVTTASVRCERGGAVWTPDGLAVRGVADVPPADEPPDHTLLSLFARRAAGGLVPVPSPDDVRAAISTTRAAGLG